MEPQVIGRLVLGGAILLGCIIGYLIGRPGKKAKAKIVEDSGKPAGIRDKPKIVEEKKTPTIMEVAQEVKQKLEDPNKLEFAKEPIVNKPKLETYNYLPPPMQYRTDEPTAEEIEQFKKYS